MEYGKAILLHGVAGVGKSSRVKELQKILRDVYYHVSIDGFCCMSPEDILIDDPWLYYTDTPYPSPPTPQLKGEAFTRMIDSFAKLVSGYHHAIEALLRTGNNVIIDHVLQRMSWTLELIELLHGYDVYMIGLFCDPEALKERREYRPIEMAPYQASVIHRGLQYDLEIDTGSIGVPESARRIKQLVESGIKPTAIKRVYEELFIAF